MTYEKQIDDLVKISRKFFQPTEVKTILEIGARDGVETVALNHFFPEALIYSFECNPATVPLWREKTRGISNIVLTEKAVSDKNGTISFFPIDPKNTKSDWKDGNPGASSLLKASGEYPVEQYAQKEITVQTINLKDFFKEKEIKRVNLIWMDIQGAELMALKGASERIGDIDIIHSEVEFLQIYEGQPLFADIKRFMNGKGFVVGYFTAFGLYSGDAVFINRRLIQNRPFLSLFLTFKNGSLYPYHRFIVLLKKPIRRVLQMLK